MALDLFAGISVRDYAVALEWYERLLGGPPSFFPNDIEAVWELAEHRFVYIELRPEHAGHAERRGTAGYVLVSPFCRISHAFRRTVGLEL